MSGIQSSDSCWGSRTLNHFGGTVLTLVGFYSRSKKILMRNPEIASPGVEEIDLCWEVISSTGRWDRTGQQQTPPWLWAQERHPWVIFPPTHMCIVSRKVDTHVSLPDLREFLPTELCVYVVGVVFSIPLKSPPSVTEWWRFKLAPLSMRRDSDNERLYIQALSLKQPN